MPIVSVQQSPRSTELKRELVARITQAFTEVYGIQAEAVQVYFSEVDDESWAKGGLLACDRRQAKPGG